MRDNRQRIFSSGVLGTTLGRINLDDCDRALFFDDEVGDPGKLAVLIRNISSKVSSIDKWIRLISNGISRLDSRIHFS